MSEKSIHFTRLHNITFIEKPCEWPAVNKSNKIISPIFFITLNVRKIFCSVSPYLISKRYLHFLLCKLYYCWTISKCLLIDPKHNFWHSTSLSSRLIFYLTKKCFVVIPVFVHMYHFLRRKTKIIILLGNLS